MQLTSHPRNAQLLTIQGFLKFILQLICKEINKESLIFDELLDFYFSINISDFLVVLFSSFFRKKSKIKDNSLQIKGTYHLEIFSPIHFAFVSDSIAFIGFLAH